MNKIKPVDFPHPVVPIMTFEQWRKSFLNKLRVGSPEWQAFHAWRHHLDEFQRSAAKMPRWDVIRKHSAKGNPFTTAPEIYILNRLYHGTLPESDKALKQKNERKKEDHYTLKELDKLATHAEEFVAHLSKRESWVASEDDYSRVDLIPLLQIYGDAAQSSRRALSLLRRPYLHNPDVLDRCLGLIAYLTRLRHRKRKKESPISDASDRQPAGVSEKGALALIHSALLAHGYKPEDLANFGAPKFRNGNVRKRLGSRTRSVAAVANVISAQTRKK